jgi:hypothetical protein
MNRRKHPLLFVAVAGAILLAEVATLGVAGQVDFAHFDGWTAAFLLVVLVGGALLLGALVVTLAERVLLGGIEDACTRLEAARASAHLEVLSAVPTVDLLARALRRQEGHFGELRDTLLAVATNPRGEGVAGNSFRVARAAGLAAGNARANTDSVRLVDVLEDWIAGARARQEEVRGLTAELRTTLEILPAAAPGAREAADPIFGYSVAEGSPLPDDDALAALPPALRARLLGSMADTENEEDGSGRN